MPNIAKALKDEITRVSRKETRGQIHTLRRASTQHRKEIAALKRQLAELQRRVSFLKGKLLGDLPKESQDLPPGGIRYSVRSLVSQRKRLGLSAADYAHLVGVSAQTIYNWERRISRPRREQVSALVALRGIGKREAKARLEEKREKKEGSKGKGKRS